ncbi:hypothetical protein CB0940_05370 [Cercospora beticola]|uniref:DRBM domain-containing protein n=1 Tax=Cercospora beticola TaxID=122368 RepID=A0A2G5HZI5_CERBT|nr:hypothetical protein CB0940_05370 [Cercospora beticola]PIA97954.1 hypothetical protein CB0940_05370 [Cercospora beticola]WPA97907.1 hypothetical protein RHO25_002518 [Cercospora beticola]CAK1359108.1 unnamed protein product [Cercospora beticola]
MSDSTTFKSAESSQPQGLTSSHIERLSETTREDTPVSSPPAKLDAHWQRCYGFGKHFFTYVLAEPLYHAALPTATGPQLDAQLQTSMTDFRYVDCLQKASAIAESADLSPPPQTRPGGHFAQLMEVIGLIALHDSTEAKRELAGAIRGSSLRGTGKERQFEGFPPSPPESVSSDEPETIQNAPHQHQRARNQDFHDGNRRRERPLQDRRIGQEVVRRDEPNMGAYATRLYEYCQQNGHGLDHEAVQASQTAATWREVVNVDGRTWIGEANTKKAARHEAFRDACIELGI